MPKLGGFDLMDQFGVKIKKCVFNKIKRVDFIKLWGFQITRTSRAIHNMKITFPRLSHSDSLQSHFRGLLEANALSLCLINEDSSIPPQ